MEGLGTCPKADFVANLIPNVLLRTIEALWQAAAQVVTLTTVSVGVSSSCYASKSFLSRSVIYHTLEVVVIPLYCRVRRVDV